jgi:hypothetical protein
MSPFCEVSTAAGIKRSGWRFYEKPLKIGFENVKTALLSHPAIAL